MLEFKRNRRVLKYLAIALALTVSQILIAWFAGPFPSFHSNYLRFCSWDCGWYASITKSGYHSIVPPVAQNGDLANVAFFPGYPIIARVLFLAANIAPSLALLLTAQFFCVAFWLAVLMILDRWKVHAFIRAISILGIFAHPAAFFLAMGYSESLFLSSLLFYFYWSDEENPRKQWLAILPGMLMTTTRIVGVPVAGYPVFRYLVQEGWGGLRKRAILKPLLIAAASSLGCLFFLVYSRIKFGDFMLYMDTQRIGWGIVPDYGALWKWSEFNYILPYERFSTIASGIALLFFWLAEFVGTRIARTRLNSTRVPLYLCASLIFYITLSGLKGSWFRSMIRYTLPWWVLCILCLAHLTTHWPARLPRPTLLQARIALVLGVGATAAFFYYFQWSYLVVFMTGRWFA